MVSFILLYNNINTEYSEECKEFISMKIKKATVKNACFIQVGMSSLLAQQVAFRGFRKSRTHSDRLIFESQCHLGHSLSSRGG